MINKNANNGYDDLLYKRGYVITKKEIQPPNKDWKCRRVANYFIYYDELNDIYYNEDNGKWVFILGNTIDVLNDTADKSRISKELLRRLNLSHETFYDYLDEISGRYLIMYSDGNEVKILSDATGMRSIIYSTQENVVASHVEIVKGITNAVLSTNIKDKWMKDYGGYHIPGHYTPYEHIYFLTPNTQLIIESKKVERFFPRDPLKYDDDIHMIVDKISELVKKQISILKETNNDFLFSLTAGIDSRTTLALTKDFRDYMQYFTYFRISKDLPNGVKSLEIDKEVVGEMVDNLNLKHRFIPLNEDEKANDYIRFTAMMKKNTFRSHSYRLAKFYYEKLPREMIHIRSNLLEIGRYFYRGKHKLPVKADINSLATCFSPKAVNDNDVKRLLENYYLHVQMDNIFNYDPFDIFYWEYRMGTWHSQLLLESDVAHETFIPFNCRAILKLLLSVSNVDKKNNSVFKGIITKNWPILNFWGINSLEKPLDSVDSQLDSYGNSLANIKFKSGSLKGSQHKVSFGSEVFGKRAKFYLMDSGPREGDFVDAEMTFDTMKETNYLALLQLRAPYENIKNSGRLKYQLFLNNELLLEEDIACWKETNQISINFHATQLNSTLSIRVVAQRNCEQWNWGKAGTILIERFTLRKSDTALFSLQLTSPFSTTLKSKVKEFVGDNISSI